MNPKKSGRGKHSYVPFYMDDWYGGTARMTRLIKSVYFDICLYTWDKAKPVPEAELMLMLDDLGPQGESIVNVLVSSGRLIRNPDNSVHSERALHEAEKAFSLWEAKSVGGKRGAKSTNDSGTPDATPVEGQRESQIHTHNQHEEGDAAHLSSADTDKPAETPKPDPLAKAKADAAVATQRKADRETVVEAWNDMARPNGFPAVRQMSEKRTVALAARLKQYGGPDDIVKAIALIPTRAFCVKNRQSWCNIDFLLRPDSVNKLLEGAYGSEGGEGWADA